MYDLYEDVNEMTDPVNYKWVIADTTKGGFTWCRPELTKEDVVEDLDDAVQTLNALKIVGGLQLMHHLQSEDIDELLNYIKLQRLLEV